MNSATNANFRTAKFRRLRKFRNLGNSRKNFVPPALEHLQQHKTKNYEKISLKMRKFTKFENFKDINENPNLKLEII